MSSEAKNHNYFKHNSLLWLLALGLAWPCATTAHAADDPFALEGGHWMSMDHYQDADKRGHLPVALPEPVDATATTADVQTPTNPSAEKTAIAAPSRPIDLPVMPGLNKGYGVKITSTIDDHPAPQASLNTEQEITPVSDKNWQSPTSIQTDHKDGTDDDGEDKPLNVRMSYLPNQKITPVSSPAHASAQKLGHEQLLKMLAAKEAAKNPPKTPAETAACAAIDAYKKQQLTAIQSDRQTLEALQEAIHSLGLDQQLKFMQDTSSALNLSGQQDTPTTVR